MNDTTKKVGLVVIVIFAAAAAIYEGKVALSDPELIKSREIGHGTPGHGMKAAEKAEEERDAAALKAGKTPDAPTGGDNLAASPKK